MDRGVGALPRERRAVRVADSGVGIAPDALPHVFELFAQADTTIDRSQGAWGSDSPWSTASCSCTETRPRPRATAPAEPACSPWDIGLPELDGYGVAARVRQELGSRIRLIALTGYGQPEDVQRAFAAGFDAHLAKPVEFDQLQAILDPGPAA